MSCTTFLLEESRVDEPFNFVCSEEMRFKHQIISVMKMEGLALISDKIVGHIHQIDEQLDLWVNHDPKDLHLMNEHY